MERQAVKSSNLSEVGYDADTQVLEVQFKKGAIYQYFDVPVEVYDELMEAESIGKAFGTMIKAGDFKYSAVGS
jgi:hypothetical protein